MLQAQAFHDLPIDWRVEFYKRVLWHLVQNHFAPKAAMCFFEERFCREIKGSVLNQFSIPILAPWALGRVIVLSGGETSLGIHFPNEAMCTHGRDKRISVLVFEHLQGV